MPRAARPVCRATNNSASTAPGPLSPGSTFQLNYRTSANELVFVRAGFGLDTVDWAPFVEQPVWLNSALATSPILVGADANGVATFTWAVPTTPVLTNAAIWFHGIAGLSAGFPLQSSPVVGGVVR